MARCDDPKKCGSRLPSALGRYPAKSPTSLRNCVLKRRSGQAASSFGEILCEKPLQPLEMYPEKIFPPDSFRFLVNSLQKVSPASGNVPRKDVPARQLPVAFFPPTAKLPRRPAAITRKSMVPDSLRLLVDPLQKASPAFGDLPRKNVHAGLPSAFGRSPAKSSASLRKCTPAIRLGLSALGCNKDKRNGT